MAQAIFPVQVLALYCFRFVAREKNLWRRSSGLDRSLGLCSSTASTNRALLSERFVEEGKPFLALNPDQFEAECV